MWVAPTALPAGNNHCNKFQCPSANLWHIMLTAGPDT
jgi:hypothetical protein